MAHPVQPAVTSMRERLCGCRVLVLGASGFIGGHLARLLGSAGPNLFLHARKWTVSPGPSTHPIVGTSTNDRVEADLLEDRGARRLLQEVRPDITINAVGYGVDRDERDEAVARRLNDDLVREITETLADQPASTEWSGLRLVHLGSAFEYGSVEGPVDEDTACRPQTGYAVTKLAGTRHVAEAWRTGLPAAVVRVPTVYGPGEHPHRLLPSLLALSTSSEPLRLTQGEQRRDFTYVEDVAEGVLRIALCRTTRWPVVNLGTGRLHVVRDFVLAALELLGLGPDHVMFGAVPYRPDEVWQGPLQIERLRALLGWVPSTDVREGLRRTIVATRG